LSPFSQEYTAIFIIRSACLFSLPKGNKDLLEIKDELQRHLKEGNITIHHAIGILVGCAEAGKTTLLRRLLGQTQDEVEDTESTRGLEVHRHIFNIKNGHLEGKSTYVSTPLTVEFFTLDQYSQMKLYEQQSNCIFYGIIIFLLKYAKKEKNIAETCHHLLAVKPGWVL
jgi:GTPase SAR1 family protein